MGRIRAGFKIGRRHKAVIKAFLDLQVVESDAYSRSQGSHQRKG